jgi:hypothetical protein
MGRRWSDPGSARRKRRMRCTLQMVAARTCPCTSARLSAPGGSLSTKDRRSPSRWLSTEEPASHLPRTSTACNRLIGPALRRPLLRHLPAADSFGFQQHP